MRFVCLVYIDQAKMDAMTPEAGQQLIEATIEEDWALRRFGQLVLAQPPLEPQHARTLRADGTITVGPFAETREHLGGFTIIEAESMEAALALTATSPILKYGSIEIRPVLDQNHSQNGEARPPLEPDPARR
jgi:hypothetical protein